jgi:hypothetical protein
MTLLTFISALKYVLSLLLATLGIIPYEEVKSSRDQDEPIKMVDVREHQPLQRMENRTFQGDQLLWPELNSAEELASIPLRDDYCNEVITHEGCFFTGEQNLPVYEYSIEMANDPEMIQKVIISFTRELETLAGEKIFVVSRGF